MNDHQTNEQSEERDLNQLIHDARGPLNRISMQAELIKLVLENDMPTDKALDAVNKILVSCQTCSHTLEQLSKSAKS
ncbi:MULTISPECIES: histidine kinase [Thalassotalea]|uniref:histidine kinase n=1 Tax=Thalassotalea TaxID=1518149 RepID=UPI000943FFF1|nr:MULTISPECIES: histidine kinase [Thalassotalea]MDO6427688.1 histidine kinase [Thalassotalea sp. 1_MG-2023]OKY25579.1 histidine kinase [Thalassotalea sp. PP2-459]